MSGTRWTQEQYAAYQSKRNEFQQKHEINQADSPPPGPVAEQVVRDGPLAKEEGKGDNTGRCVVRITSYRVRLTDPDNLTPKWFIDALRYAGVIYDDRPQDIDLQVSQKKVAKKAEQRTEIEVIWPPK